MFIVAHKLLTGCGLNGTFSFDALQFPAGGQVETVLCCRGTDAANMGPLHVVNTPVPD